MRSGRRICRKGCETPCIIHFVNVLVCHCNVRSQFECIISKLLSWISDNLPKSQMQEKSYLLRAWSSILDKPQRTVHFELNDVNNQGRKQSSWLRLKMHSSEIRCNVHSCTDERHWQTGIIHDLIWFFVHLNQADFFRSTHTDVNLSLSAGGVK